MNTMITSTHFTYPRVRIAATVLGALISSFAAVCRRGRLHRCAPGDREICGSRHLESAGCGDALQPHPLSLGSVVRAFVSRDLAPSPVLKCVQRAIEGAVAKVNRPGLSAFYVAKYRVQQPAKLLTADRR